jgi:NAD(P)-dependent dehydrogenase (short-subunit alcohol dehydrogenase family)
MRAYGRSKLMNILFTRELARRLVGTGVTANCLHPGFVATRFGDASGGGWLFRVGLRFGKKRFGLTPQAGAETLVYLASSQDVQNVSGAYFVRCRQVTPSRAAQSAEDARQLWEASARIAGVGIPA